MTIAYAIRHKTTKEQWKARSGRNCWAKPGHAKAAWHSTYGYGKYFDDQEAYEIYSVGKDEEAELAKAVALLRKVIYTGALTFDGQFEELEGDICSFLEDKS